MALQFVDDAQVDLCLIFLCCHVQMSKTKRITRRVEFHTNRSLARSWDLTTVLSGNAVCTGREY